MEKPGKIEVTKKQAEQLVEHLQQYVWAAKYRKKVPKSAPHARECTYCAITRYGDCSNCILSYERQGGVFCTDPDDGFLSSNWNKLTDSGIVPADHEDIMARARVLQERTNKWIYPWQIEDLSRVVKKEDTE